MTGRMMKARITLAALTMTGLIFATPSINANDKLTLRVTPNVSSAPSTVTVRAYVEPNEKNRLLRIEADSGEFFRSSQIQLDGDKAPTLTEFRFNSLPSGEYTVEAVLKDSTGEETVVRRTALVLSAFGEKGQ
jgi:hypothetical protein